MFARGLNRMALFADDRDREHLLELLGKTVEQYQIEVHACAWMQTHWHLVVRTPEGNLSRAMQWLTTEELWARAGGGEDKRRRSGASPGRRSATDTAIPVLRWSCGWRGVVRG